MKRSRLRDTGQANAERDAEEAVDAASFDQPTINAAGRAFLERTMRFLIAVQSPQFADRAYAEGYTPAEHAIGWQLWNKATGQHRPLTHWLSMQPCGTSLNRGVALHEKLRTLDAFENVWYPRIRQVIRRVVSVESRDTFESAFFQGLTQQPVGPSVVGSVSGLISRVRGLASSGHPEAAKVLAVLRARGLTEDKLAEITELTQGLAQGEGCHYTGMVEAKQVLKGQQEQYRAMRELHDWFLDWATMLRTVFDCRECVTLGLSVPRKPSAKAARAANASAGAPQPPAPGLSSEAPAAAPR